VRVATGVQQCPLTTVPGADCSGGYRAFTAHDLVPGVAIAQGQTVDITIVFSFN